MSTNVYLANEISFNNYCNAEILRKIQPGQNCFGDFKSHEEQAHLSEQVTVLLWDLCQGFGTLGKKCLKAKDKKGLLTFEMNYKMLY